MFLYGTNFWLPCSVQHSDFSLITASFKNVTNFVVLLMSSKFPGKPIWHCTYKQILIRKKKKTAYIGRYFITVFFFPARFDFWFIMVYWNTLICFTLQFITFRHLFYTCIAVVLQRQCICSLQREMMKVCIYSYG